MATHLRPRARKQPGFFNDELDSAADDNDLFIVERLVARRKKKVRRNIQCNTMAILCAFVLFTHRHVLNTLHFGKVILRKSVHGWGKTP